MAAYRGSSRKRRRKSEQRGMISGLQFAFGLSPKRTVRAGRRHTRKRIRSIFPVSKLMKRELF